MTEECRFGHGYLHLRQGDITTASSDAIVNAANEGLRGGGGVDGAIHRAGGSTIMKECRKIRHCPTGHAVVTCAGNLASRYVIHTVGPVWHGGTKGEPALLANCYTNSLRLASKLTLSSIAFPSISTGVYGYPVDAAAKIAITSIRDYLEAHSGFVSNVTLVLFDSHTLHAYEDALQAIAGGPST